MMKKKPYTLFLDRKEGKVSVITLKNNIIQTINYIKAKDLDKLLK
jgi:hypothetical protein